MAKKNRKISKSGGERSETLSEEEAIDTSATLEAWTSSNWELEKNPDVIKIKSGAGFYDEERPNAPVKIRISVEEL